MMQRASEPTAIRIHPADRIVKLDVLYWAWGPASSLPKHPQFYVVGRYDVNDGRLRRCLPHYPIG